jgi:hypothetical protein
MSDGGISPKSVILNTGSNVVFVCEFYGINFVGQLLRSRRESTTACIAVTTRQESCEYSTKFCLITGYGITFLYSHRLLLESIPMVSLSQNGPVKNLIVNLQVSLKKLK